MTLEVGDAGNGKLLLMNIPLLEKVRELDREEVKRPQHSDSLRFGWKCAIGNQWILAEARKRWRGKSQTEPHEDYPSGNGISGETSVFSRQRNTVA